MDMADLIAEVKRLNEKIKELEAKAGGGDPEKVAALEKKIEALEKKAEKLAKPLEDSDFDAWD